MAAIFEKEITTGRLPGLVYARRDDYRKETEPVWFDHVAKSINRKKSGNNFLEAKAYRLKSIDFETTDRKNKTKNDQSK